MALIPICNNLGNQRYCAIQVSWISGQETRADCDVWGSYRVTAAKSDEDAPLGQACGYSCFVVDGKPQHQSFTTMAGDVQSLSFKARP